MITCVAPVSSVSIAAVSSMYCASTAGSTWIWWKSATVLGEAHELEALTFEVGVHAPRAGDHHRLPGERHHRVERFVLGHVLEHGAAVRRPVADVVDLGFHAGHARTLHITGHL